MSSRLCSGVLILSASCAAGQLWCKRVTQSWNSLWRVALCSCISVTGKNDRKYGIDSRVRFCVLIFSKRPKIITIFECQYGVYNVIWTFYDTLKSIFELLCKLQPNRQLKIQWHRKDSKTKCHKVEGQCGRVSNQKWLGCLQRDALNIQLTEPCLFFCIMLYKYVNSVRKGSTYEMIQIEPWSLYNVYRTPLQPVSILANQVMSQFYQVLTWQH